MSQSRISRKSRYADMERIVDGSDDEGAYDGGRGRKSQSSSLPDGGFAALSEAQQDELTQRFVRYMLCRQARKRPVRRADLSKHLFRNMTNITSKGRVFSGTLSKAQNELRNVFGMEVIEIARPIRRTNTQTQGGVSAATSGSQASGGKSTKAYILVSALDPSTRVEDRPRLAEIGFLTVVACMVLMKPGCRISEEELSRALGRIGVQVVERSGHKQLNEGNVKDLIDKEFVEQWYLDRESEGNSVFYSLGPRLRAELKDEDLLDFVEAIYQSGSDTTSMLDSTARQELQQRLSEANRTEDDVYEEGD